MQNERSKISPRRGLGKAKSPPTSRESFSLRALARADAEGCSTSDEGSRLLAGAYVSSSWDKYSDEISESQLQPWQLNPRQLISWLDMLVFSAEAFFWCGASLREIRTDCLLGSAVALNNQPGFHLSRDINTKGRERALKTLPGIEEQFRHLGLMIAAQITAELIENLNEPEPRQNFQWLMDKVDNIENIARKELANRLFLFVPPERIKFWPRKKEPDLFGNEVANKFPSAYFDIGNAGICLATASSTASVFHLMRVLELGLTALGKVFNVSLAHTNWEPAIDEIVSKIKNMRHDPLWKAVPDYKEQQEFFSQAASHFFVLKDAWRNYTMHSRAKYTEAEAESIYENVKSFMQKLATRIGE